MDSRVASRNLVTKGVNTVSVVVGEKIFVGFSRLVLTGIGT